MFGKWFASSYTGSMYGAGSHIFAVWSWVIANAGRNGQLEINPTMLARTIGEDETKIRDAIEFLTAPDPCSRSKLEGGRRILYGGGFDYQIVNFDHYRKMRNEEDRRAYKAEKARAYRAKAKAAEPPSPPDAAGLFHDRVHNDSGKSRAGGAITIHKPAKPVKLPPEDAQRIAQFLYDSILSHTPDFLSTLTPPDTGRTLIAWAVEIERAIRGVGFQKRHNASDPKIPNLPATAEDLRAIIAFAHGEPGGFWTDKLISGRSLRAQAGKGSILAQARRRSAPTLADKLGEFDFTEARAKLDAYTGPIS